MKATDTVLNLGTMLFFVVFHAVKFTMAAIATLTVCFIILIHDLVDKEKPVPKKVEEKLKKQADKKGLKGEAKDAYVYGTLDKIEKGKSKPEKKGKR